MLGAGAPAVTPRPERLTRRVARRPYDLRHAVSTRLDAGVPATRAHCMGGGTAFAVLLQIYAKCLVGQEDAPRRRIAAVLGES